MMQKENYLIEGISHIEDLPVSEFIAAIKNISNMIATEKLDGAQLWFGLDQSGRLFTSRAGKRRSAENIYSADEYKEMSASNGFRGAHAALQAKEDEIKKILRPGETIEIEVLYGRQPNAVTYGAGGKNYIAFLRGVLGTPDSSVNQLANMLNGTQVTVNVPIVDTTDGVNLSVMDADLEFQFVGVQQIDSNKLKDVNVDKQLKKLETFLNAPADLKGMSLTNAELIGTSLGSIDKSIRPEAKLAKEEALARIMTSFKLPIKKELLDNFVKKIKPSLSADDLNGDEDNGIEGVVLRDPVNGNQVKLVDKDGFSTINQFNYAVRNQISGPIRSVDDASPLETRGGIIGNLRIKIADLMGNKDLARPMLGKKVFQSVKGSTPEATMKNVISGLKGSEDFRATKRKVLALIKATNAELSNALDKFKDQQNNYQLLLKNGKKIGLSQAVVKRTLLAFAESKKDLKQMFERVYAAKSFSQLAVIFWGRYALSIHEAPDENISEEVVLEKKFDTDKRLYQNKDSFTLLNIYLATVLLSSLMYKVKDKKGLQLLRDKTHYRMTSWAANMSPLNFWGYPIWKSSQPAVKKLIGNKTSRELGKIVKKVPSTWSRMLHMDLSFGNDVPINWNDHYKTLKQLQWFPGLKTDRINKLIIGTLKYEDLDLNQRIKTLNALYFYAQQFIPSSPLIQRLKTIQHNVLVNANGENDFMIEGSLLKQISETAIGASDAGSIQPGQHLGLTSPAVAPVAAQTTPPIPGDKSFVNSTQNNNGSATVASNISSVDNKVGSGKMIVRVKRNPNVIKKKFARPEKVKKNESN